MRNILITGGAGYIGSFTAHLLSDLGYNIIIIDNLNRGFRESLPLNVEFINADLKNVAEIEPVFQKNKFDLIIHLAALAFVKESVDNPELYLQNNIKSTENIIFLAQKYNTKKIIFSSSCTIYGNENQKNLLSEDSLLKPINPYGISKLACEEMIKNSGLNYLILRYFNVAGANMQIKIGHRTSFTSHLIHSLSRAVVKDQKVIINGDGSYVRDYIHVYDVAHIHKLAVNYILNENCYEIINCGYGVGYSVLDIISQFEDINNIKVKVGFGPVRPGDPDYLVCNNSKLQKLLKWKSVFDQPLSDICRSSFEWEKYFQSKI